MRTHEDAATRALIVATCHRRGGLAAMHCTDGAGNVWDGPLCVTNLRDNATSWGIYVAQLGDRRQDRTIR